MPWVKSRFDFNWLQWDQDLSLDVAHCGPLWPTVHNLHGTLILDEGSQCGNSMSLMSLAPFRMTNTSSNFLFPASGISADLSSRATVLPCPISPYSHLDLECVAKHMVQRTPGALERGECPVSNPTQYRENGWLHRYHSSSPFPVLSHQREVKTPWNTRAIAATLGTKKLQ